MPKFSIIVPVYNVAPYLRECLDSVLAQTFADWECLCVDDGSTDESGVILDEYAEKDSRFRIFHKENGGVSSARNLALDNVQGEWVWFVDGDDEIAGNALEVFQGMVNGLTASDCVEFGVTRGVDGWTSDVLFRNVGAKDILNVFDMQNISQRKEYLFKMRLSVCWYFLWGRGLVENIRFQGYSLSEDTLFAHSAALGAHHIVRTPYIAYFYRERPGSAVMNVSKKKVEDRTNALLDLMSILKKTQDLDYARYFLDREWFLQGLLWIFKINDKCERCEMVRFWLAKTFELGHELQTFRLKLLRTVYFLFGYFGIKYLLYFPISKLLVK